MDFLTDEMQPFGKIVHLNDIAKIKRVCLHVIVEHEAAQSKCDFTLVSPIYDLAKEIYEKFKNDSTP